MIRRWPLIPTILVAARGGDDDRARHLAAPARRREAGAARRASPRRRRLPPIGWPTAPLERRHCRCSARRTGNCLEVAGFRTAAGQNRDGEPGFLVIADCRVGAEGPGMAVELGWSKNPNAGRDYKGGLVSGVIAPDSVARMRLVVGRARARA